MKDKMNKALKLTRSEGGLKVDTPFDIYEHELANYSNVEKKEVFSKIFKRKITSRVIKIHKVYVHALFFEDGSVYNVTPNGFVKRTGKEITL